MGVIVRPAEERDIPSLAQLYIEFHNFHAAGVPRRLRPVESEDEALREGIRRLAGGERTAILVACADQAIVGFAEVHIKDNDPHPAVLPRRYGQLQSLAVAAAMRRRGLGARLVAAAHGWARSRGASEMQIDTWEFPGGPLPFYEGLGYRTQRRTLVAKL